MIVQCICMLYGNLKGFFFVHRKGLQFFKLDIKLFLKNRKTTHHNAIVRCLHGSREKTLQLLWCHLSMLSTTSHAGNSTSSYSHLTLILRPLYDYLRYLFLGNKTLQRSYKYPMVDVQSPYGVNAPYGFIMRMYIYVYIFWAMGVNPYIFDEMALVPPQRLQLEILRLGYNWDRYTAQKENIVSNIDKIKAIVQKLIPKMVKVVPKSLFWTHIHKACIRWAKTSHRERCNWEQANE